MKLLDLAAIRARCDAADVPALLAYVHDLEQELAENDRLRDKEREEWASRRCECSASDSCKMARERDEAVHACAAALAERITWYQRGREEALKEKL